MSRRTKKLPELGIIKTKNETITEEDMKRISELKEEGYMFIEMDRAYSRKYGTIARYYKNWLKGSLPKQPGRPGQLEQQEEFDHDKLGALLRAGWGLKDLMVEFSADEEEIKMRIKELIKREKSKNGNNDRKIHSIC